MWSTRIFQQDVAQTTVNKPTCGRSQISVAPHLTTISKTPMAAAIVSTFSCVLRLTMAKPTQKKLTTVQNNRVEVVN